MIWRFLSVLQFPSILSTSTHLHDFSLLVRAVTKATRLTRLQALTSRRSDCQSVPSGFCVWGSPIIQVHGDGVEGTQLEYRAVSHLGTLTAALIYSKQDGGCLSLPWHLICTCDVDRKHTATKSRLMKPIKSDWGLAGTNTACGSGNINIVCVMFGLKLTCWCKFKNLLEVSAS